MGASIRFALLMLFINDIARGGAHLGFGFLTRILRLLVLGLAGVFHLHTFFASEDLRRLSNSLSRSLDQFTGIIQFISNYVLFFKFSFFEFSFSFWVIYILVY
jgi:hypothetical protein